jgi:hypothetical protein
MQIPTMKKMLTIEKCMDPFVRVRAQHSTNRRSDTNIDPIRLNRLTGLVETAPSMAINPVESARANKKMTL